MPLLILSSLLCLAGVVISHWLHNQHHLDVIVRPQPPGAQTALISVCVPARNEEHNIRACLTAILAQTYRNLEVIVVDDRSTDQTAAQVQALGPDPRLHLIAGAELPAGWAGKPHALDQAAGAAHGDWLCFVDADTFLAPEALAACHAKALETGADLFTILTAQITGTFWEKAVLPLVMTALSVGFSPRKVNDPARRDAIANGQFILIKRSVYSALGGHARLRDQIVEDKALAQQVKWNGYRLILADGMRVASTRMYTSLAQLWEGWTKNIYLGLRDQAGLLLLGAAGICLLTVAALFLPLWPLLGWLWYLHGGGWLGLAVTGESLLVWGVLLVERARSLGKMGISAWYALTTPLGAAVFSAMMLTSAWNVISGRGVTWRGRTYNPAR